MKRAFLNGSAVVCPVCYVQCWRTAGRARTQRFPQRSPLRKFEEFINAWRLAESFLFHLFSLTVLLLQRD